MLRNPFSSRTSDLSLEKNLELANKSLELSRNESDAAKALELANSANLMLKDAEKIFATEKAKDPALGKGIANAYHEHGKLLDDLGHHDKAVKSHSKAEKWGYIKAVNQHTGSSQPVLSPAGAATRQPISKSDVVQLSPQLSTQKVIPTKVSNGKPTSNSDVQIPKQIFDQNITPPVTKYDLPEAGGRITSTPQLAYCLGLLHPSMSSNAELGQSERDWIQDRVNDPDEQLRLQTMGTDLVRAFVREELKKPNVINEVMTLTAVIGQEDFRKLLQTFVDGINQSVLLKVHLLDGLAPLIRNAGPGNIDADDLVKILGLLSARLKDTHGESTQHTYQLALTISQVLDSMVDSQVEGLSREQLHEPLSDFLKGLQESSDPLLNYQAAYAYQALQYISDDETILQSMMRRTGEVVQGISGVVSAVKALDVNGFLEGLKGIQEGLAGAVKAAEVIKDTYSNVMTLAEEGQGLLTSLKESFVTYKGSWYPALRGLDGLVQEGRFVEFEKLVREAPCQKDPAFRWGLCQRLGEIAANPIWDLHTRKCALNFLRQLYQDYSSRGQQVVIMQWILYILSQLAESSPDIVGSSAKEILQEVQANSSTGQGILLQDGGDEGSMLNPKLVAPPQQDSPLLNCVQNAPDVETPLRQLRRERLMDRGGDIYISPRAKATLRATDDFDLTTKVQEFLQSNKKVLLILGDSGSGKSTFNRALEISLWDNYDKPDKRIPLFIHLPEMEYPERDLIAEKLRRVNFTESQILELKQHREFILICDGYDESQQTNNLYMSNQLNQLNSWKAQMVISCRTEYTGVEYRDCFQPFDRNRVKNTNQFQEAIITPFTKEQIQDYVGKYVSLGQSPWGSEDYLQAIKQIRNLQDLVQNPFLLRMALEVLPRLLKSDAKFSSTHITRIQLYDEFVEQWIERGKIRLMEMDLSPNDQNIFKQLQDFGFRQCGIKYLKELVTAIYEHQKGNPVVKYPEYPNRKSWKETFFSGRDGNNLLWEAIPLTRNGDQYRFIHKSLLEYGLSLAIFGPSKYNEDAEATPPVSRRGSTSSVLSFELPSPTEQIATANKQTLLDTPLAKRNLVSEASVLQFLTERAQQEPIFKVQLHSLIEKCKTDKKVRTAAANAITILIRAGVQFNGADLRNINIPGADLSFGVFDSAQLEGADLRKVNLRSVWLRQASLKGARVDSLQLGELPLITEASKVNCCAYSPDGKLFAAGSAKGVISLYDASSWNKIQTLKGHQKAINSLSFSATSNQIASGSDDNTIQLWDVDTGKSVHTFEGHRDYVQSVMFSPKGDLIASGSDDNTVRLWDIETGKCLHILKDHSGEVNSIAYSPKGDQVVSAGDDDAVIVWDVDTGKSIHTLWGHTGLALSVAYSPKGDHIASGGEDTTVRLWDAETGECLHTLEGHTGSVFSVMYSPRGGQIASGSEDKTVRLWDAETGDCLNTLLGHSDEVNNAVYSPKGNQIASGSDDKTVRLWDVDACEYVHMSWGHSKSVRTIAYSPNGDHAVSGSDDTTVRLWDVGTGECIHILRDHTSLIRSVLYSSRGDQFASASDDKTVRLWDAGTGKCIHTLQGHSDWIYCIAYSSDDSQIASGGEDSTVRVWDVGTGECIHTLCQDSSILYLKYAPKGFRIATAGYDSEVWLWDTITGECIHTFQGHSNWAPTAAYSPKGDQVASGSYDKTVRLWNVDTGKCVRTLKGHRDSVSSVVYSPEGDRIASGSNDMTVRLWDVNTGKCIHVLLGHTGWIRVVTYSPNGDCIASGSDDMTARLWDAETGQCLAIISGFSHKVCCIALERGPSTQYLATGSYDKSVRRWRIDTEGAEHKATLCWSSSHEILTVADASFEDIQGLSQLDQKLLTQRRALISQPLPSE